MDTRFGAKIPLVTCCFHCRKLFNHETSEFCWCITEDPTVVCTHCGRCFCEAPGTWKHSFWMAAPASVWKGRREQRESAVIAPYSVRPLDKYAPKLLVIDPNPVASAAALRLGQLLNLTTVLAADSEEALRVARTLRPDIMLVETVQPKIPGIELARRLRVECPDSVIYFVSETDRGELFRSEAITPFRANGFLKKPISRERFLTLLQNILLRIESAPVAVAS